MVYSAGTPILSSVYTERKSFLVSVDRIPGKYLPGSGTVALAANIYGRTNSLGRCLGETSKGLS